MKEKSWSAASMSYSQPAPMADDKKLTAKMINNGALSQKIAGNLVSGWGEMYQGPDYKK